MPRSNYKYYHNRLNGVLTSLLFKDIIQPGTLLKAETPTPEKYYNDLLHPCVRYIEEGFAGHKWWMVASPFRGKDDKIENPILYFGKSDNKLPPMEWIATVIVEDTHSKGYNSDPTLFFDGSYLWVIWREVWSESCDATSSVIVCKRTKDGLQFSPKIKIAQSSDPTGNLISDNLICPIILTDGQKLTMYSVDYLFNPIRIFNGLSIWSKDNNYISDSFFHYEKTILPSLSTFTLWHFDLFKYNDILFCVAGTSDGNSIYLGWSKDFCNFHFWNRPLITSKKAFRFFYKPSAMVLNDTFYLWYSCALPGKFPRTTRLCMSKMPFQIIINKLNKYSSTKLRF